MTEYPVHYAVQKPERFSRAQLVARIGVFIVLGIVGVSLGSFFALLYVLLPLFAAIRLAGRDADAYLREDGPNVVGMLRWFAAVYGWMGLVTERLPSRAPEQTVHIEVRADARPTPTSALVRLVVGLPSALALALVGIAATFVWLWAAVCVLVDERIGDRAHAFLVGVQRWAVRLLAYQASLVEGYPPFGFDDVQRLEPAPDQPMLGRGT